MVLIGVTPATDDATGKITVNQDYLDAVERSGALPVLLPLTDNQALLEAMLERIDGLLFTGGADVGPQMYGQETLPLCGETNPRRDRMEFPLCRMALEKDMPILAICRGYQVLNCLLGGTLYQDIGAQYGPALSHPQYDHPADPVHAVTVEEGTLLRRLTGLNAFRVNSRHHQGICRLGRGLRVCARAEDGLIEGVELSGKKFVLGVQWHPESLSDRHPEAQQLFNALTEACKG